MGYMITYNENFSTLHLLDTGYSTNNVLNNVLVACNHINSLICTTTNLRFPDTPILSLSDLINKLHFIVIDITFISYVKI